MNYRIFYIAIFVLSVFSFSSNSIAASFDCSKAKSQTEKFICSDNELSRLDEDLAGLYKEALHIPGMKSEQRKWLTSLKKCSDAACLKAAYQERMDAISQEIIFCDRNGGCR